MLAPSLNSPAAVVATYRQVALHAFGSAMHVTSESAAMTSPVPSLATIWVPLGHCSGQTAPMATPQLEVLTPCTAGTMGQEGMQYEGVPA